ncbi:hypothetical protein [Nocardia sp. CY41]|uniref:hypothetical protein n=1 Tax=Nocardia sp. CY41 TaxID=2608686 RepID=UPI0013589474|nr:hypothetical protein [Nocardia sp. CY41]
MFDSDTRPTPTTKVMRFLSEVAEQQAVLNADGIIDYAAELTVRALAASVATGHFHGDTEINGVVAVLADERDTYTDAARAYMDLARSGHNDLYKRASAFDTASARLTAIIDALAAEFRGVISLRARWLPGGVVEVFDYEGRPGGANVPLDPPATPAATLDEVTRQLAQAGFVVVGEWELQLVTSQVEEYMAALRLSLSF